MSILQLIGSQNCRIFTKDVAYHAWPPMALKRGVTCMCGSLRIKRVHKNGDYESESCIAAETPAALEPGMVEGE